MSASTRAVPSLTQVAERVLARAGSAGAAGAPTGGAPAAQIGPPRAVEHE